MNFHLGNMHFGPNKRLHADAQTYAAFVGFAALHFTTKASPVWALVSRALCEKAMIWPFRKKEYTNEEVLNEAFHLAMAWGKDWLQPIQKRLAKMYPELKQKELDEYNSIAQEVMKFGYDQVYAMAELHGKQADEKEFAVILLRKYPWVSKKNTSHCFNQGMYYTWKDNGLK